MAQIVGRGKTLSKLANAIGEGRSPGKINESNNQLKIGRGNLVLANKNNVNSPGAVVLLAINSAKECQKDQSTKEYSSYCNDSKYYPALELLDEDRSSILESSGMNGDLKTDELITQHVQNGNVDLNSLEPLPETADETENVSFLTSNITIEDKTEIAEMHWQMNKCERKITQVLKNVSDDSLGTVIDELLQIVKERPLSSRYANCSEIKKLIEVLIKKGVEKEELFEFVPCLLKNTTVECEIESKKYFHDIAEDKRKEYITLCASDVILSNYAKSFCRLLGRMLVMPRQENNSFYELVQPFVEDCVERWTFPDKMQANLNGIPESLAEVYAFAVKYLLVEIAGTMIKCDSAVEKLMERYVWYIRESALNSRISRKLREIYLDAYLDIQNAATPPPLSDNVDTASTTDFETSEIESEYGDAVLENLGNDEVKDKLENTSLVENHVGKEKEKLYTDSLLEDPYLCIRYLLKEVDSLDILPQFMEKEVDDALLALPTFRQNMQEKGFKPFLAYSIKQCYNSMGIEELKEKAMAYAREIQLPSKLDSLEIEKQSKKEDTIEQTKNSSRLAMTFNITKSTSVSKTEVKSSDNFYNNTQTSINHTNKSKDIQNASQSDSDSDIVIEEEYEETDSSTIDTTSTQELYDNKAKSISESNTSEKMTPPVNLQTNVQQSVSIGRGKGMIRLPNANTPAAFKSVAKVSPMQHNRAHRKFNNSSNSHFANSDRHLYRAFNRKEHKSPHRRRQNHTNSFHNTPNFKPVYHANRPTKKENENKNEIELGFGLNPPKQCEKCSSFDHVAEDCYGNNPFF